jgi:hypothetical protein
MTLHFLPPLSASYEDAVDYAIATCNGDLRGALKALIIANEFLERDLKKALAGPVERSSRTGCRDTMSIGQDGHRPSGIGDAHPDRTRSPHQFGSKSGFTP